MEADFSQFDHLVDIFGNMPFIKRYMALVLAFSLPASQSQESVVSDLEASLRRLTAAIPWLAGKVIYEGRDDTHTGTRKIVRNEGKIPLIVKDLSSEGVPSIEDLARTGFPLSMLQAEVLVPPIALTWHSDGYDKLAPVLLLQANFVQGGMLLTIAGNHSTMDMTGLGIVIEHLAKACRNEALTDDEVRQANADRREIVALLEKDYQPGNELDDSLIVPNAPAISLEPAEWVSFSLSGSGSSALKTAAAEQSVAPYVSTDDAISALFWQRTCVARSNIHPDAFPATSLLARTVSARPYLGIDSYLGHMVDCVYSRLEITKMSLGDLAGRLRLLLNKDKIIRHLRAYLTVLDRMEDKSLIISGAQLNLNWDFVVSSYGNLKTSRLDFGASMGGYTLAVRVPGGMPAAPGCSIILPADRNGDISVALCGTEKEIAALKEDDVLGKYAAYVG
ncbi:Trichothecene 3-O-acetyltransferase [Cyphellophora attinorum]|uniref:Trichothecene 3-O-acetyltransferase n=1 Tax=Cyphellophora attinorum TaxID=1664694 RepID=A0A0N1H5Q0_9EURO|nr:Trichothecene 3-O-acetyltransferase [Phialophora attinorum]KPI41150.1 Trichothecene 3-O-acetyltransferase [Phialophora attinorum]